MGKSKKTRRGTRKKRSTRKKARSFKKAAKALVRAAKSGKGRRTTRKGGRGVPAAYSVPVIHKQRFDFWQSKGGDGVIVDGCEYLESARFSNSATKGTDVLDTKFNGTIKLNPAMLAPESRLATMASMYERFMFIPKHTTIHYQPASSTQGIGALIMGWEPDPKDKFPSNNADRVKFMFNHKHHTTFSVYKPGSVSAPARLPKQPEYWIDNGDGADADLRQTVQAEARCIVETDLGSTATTTTAGSFWIHYRVKLFQAKFDVRTIRTARAGSWSTTPSEGGGGVPLSLIDPFTADSSSWPGGGNTWRLGGSVDGTGVGGDEKVFVASREMFTSVDQVLAVNITVYITASGYDWKTATEKAPAVNLTHLSSMLDGNQYCWTGASATVSGSPWIYFTAAQMDGTTGAGGTSDAVASWMTRIKLGENLSNDPHFHVVNLTDGGGINTIWVFIEEIPVAEFEAKARMHQMRSKILQMSKELDNAMEMLEKKEGKRVDEEAYKRSLKDNRRGNEAPPNTPQGVTSATPAGITSSLESKSEAKELRTPRVAELSARQQAKLQAYFDRLDTQHPALIEARRLFYERTDGDRADEKLEVQSVDSGFDDTEIGMLIPAGQTAGNVNQAAAQAAQQILLKGKASEAAPATKRGS